MKLWPAYTASFTTSLSVKDALARLHAEIGKPAIFEFTIGPVNSSVTFHEERRDFLGKQLPDGGEFARNLNTTPGNLRDRNGFQPITRCRIEPAAKGARVTARMRMRVIPSLFAATWIAVMFSAFALFVTAPLEEGSSRWVAFIPLGMAAVLWLIICFSFSEDVERTERLLRATLERD